MMRPAAILAASWIGLAAGSVMRADEAPVATREFEAQIAPMLARHCQRCHGGEKPKSGLSVTSLAALLQGGESGPVVVPGQADKSLLVEMIADGSMPPEDQPKLSGDEIALVRRWIDAGAPGPRAPSGEAVAGIDPAAREFWAFRVLSTPRVPSVDPRAVRTPVDAFIVAALAEAGLALAPQADRMTLVRRASYDLVGLPPTAEQIDAFLADERPDAYERLIDRLLASPHFGERWGRHWLDAAGYSDITGGDNDAAIIKLSEGKWKYRDWVVRAFNADKPYDRFLIEQLAGDELIDWRSAASFTPETHELLIATGFLRNAADDTDERELTTPDILHGIVQRTTEVVANNLLGLTLGCAKCHDHKYEPIAQRDYYRLLANFTPTFNPASWVQPRNRALADIAPVERARREKHNAELDAQIAALKKGQDDVRSPARTRILQTKYNALPEAIREDVRAALQLSAAERNEIQKYLADKFKGALDVSPSEIDAALGEAEKQQISEAERHIDELNRTRQTWGTIQAAYDVGSPPQTHLLRRGNHETPGAVVEPGFLSVLCSNRPAPASGPSHAARPIGPAGQTSGRRLALATWLTDWQSPAGGLAARVMVNRVWQHLFGRGIVATSENLGLSGAAPTHPELLEWLACRFVAEGRQLKPLLKLLMTSAVYRQASRRVDSAELSAAARPFEVDPGNRLLWRMPLKRLEAEIVRDALLAASGRLDPSLGGPSLPLEVQSDGMVVIQDKGAAAASAKARRSLYVLARRNYHLSLLDVFDQPAMSMNCPNRQQSAVVLQSLTMLNDAFVLGEAERFARRVAASSPGASEPPRVSLAFRIALGRDPSNDEMEASLRLLRDHAEECALAGLPAEQANEKALAHLCHMLFSSNEFLYVP